MEKEPFNCFPAPTCSSTVKQTQPGVCIVKGSASSVLSHPSTIHFMFPPVKKCGIPEPLYDVYCLKNMPPLLQRCQYLQCTETNASNQFNY